MHNSRSTDTRSSRGGSLCRLAAAAAARSGAVPPAQPPDALLSQSPRRCRGAKLPRRAQVSARRDTTARRPALHDGACGGFSQAAGRQVTWLCSGLRNQRFLGIVSGWLVRPYHFGCNSPWPTGMTQLLCHAIGEQLPVAGIPNSGPECRRRDRGEQRLEIAFQASASRQRPGQPGQRPENAGADVRGRSDVLVALLTIPAANRVEGSTRRAAQRIKPVLCVLSFVFAVRTSGADPGVGPSANRRTDGDVRGVPTTEGCGGTCIFIGPYPPRPRKPTLFRRGPPKP